MNREKITELPEINIEKLHGLQAQLTFEACMREIRGETSSQPEAAMGDTSTNSAHSKKRAFIALSENMKVGAVVGIQRGDVFEGQLLYGNPKFPGVGTKLIRAVQAQPEIKSIVLTATPIGLDARKPIGNYNIRIAALKKFYSDTGFVDDPLNGIMVWKRPENTTIQK